MKKFISVLLALIMVMSAFSASAFAVSTGKTSDGKTTVTVDGKQIVITYTDDSINEDTLYTATYIQFGFSDNTNNPDKVYSVIVDGPESINTPHKFADCTASFSFVDCADFDLDDAIPNIDCTTDTSVEGSTLTVTVNVNDDSIDNISEELVVETFASTAKYDSFFLTNIFNYISYKIRLAFSYVKTLFESL